MLDGRDAAMVAERDSLAAREVERVFTEGHVVAEGDGRGSVVVCDDLAGVAHVLEGRPDPRVDAAIAVDDRGGPSGYSSAKPVLRPSFEAVARGGPVPAIEGGGERSGELGRG